MPTSGIPPPVATPLGTPIPALLPHAISVSLPKWKDNVDYEEGKSRVMDKLQNGYPRFFIHRSIQKLEKICLQKFGQPHENCMLFPSPRVAQEARKFLLKQPKPVSSRIVEFVICPSTGSLVTPLSSSSISNLAAIQTAEEAVVGDVDCIELQILLYAKESQPIAKQFWQHTGDGISSRVADRALAFLGEGPAPPLGDLLAPSSKRSQIGQDVGSGSTSTNGSSTGTGAGTGAAAVSASTELGKKAAGKLSYSRNRHYAKAAIGRGTGRDTPATTTRFGSESSPPAQTPLTEQPSFASQPSSSSIRPAKDNDNDDDDDEDLEGEGEGLSLAHSVYLEERYGRNLPLTSSKLAKLAMRRRIAGVLLPHEKAPASGAGALSQLPRGENREGGGGKIVSEDDVYLYPCGMSSIWHAHQLAINWKTRSGSGEQAGKSVCFGFPYTDTLKILQKWGPGCHFFGHGTSSDLESLSELLHNSRTLNEPPILALFCEFPSNPLLRSPDIKRLRELADEFGFLIIVDETIGNFVNVEVASWADIVVSSLTKVFSGDTNVMGGSLVLPPQSKHYNALKEALEDSYEDNYFEEDAIYLERNSRDFRTRIAAINEKAYDLTEWLEKRSLTHPEHPAGSVISQVFYPRFITPENYAIAQRLPSTGKGGFGGLFALTFASMPAAEAFFDNLDCCKGPSLGTNFTLACPYTIIAHYYELEWASEYGVDASLVRVSVGLEHIDNLKETFARALDAAEKAHVAQQE